MVVLSHLQKSKHDILYLNYIHFTKNIDEFFPFAIIQWYFVCFYCI